MQVAEDLQVMIGHMLMQELSAHPRGWTAEAPSTRTAAVRNSR